MQIKRHWLLVETMPFEYFFSGVGVHSGCGDTTASLPEYFRQLKIRSAAGSSPKGLSSPTGCCRFW